jgi:plastocyanin
MRGTVTVTLAGGVDTGESSERMEAATAEAERQMAEATAQTERRIANATAEAEKRMMEATVEAEKMEKETATTGPQVAAEIKSSTLPNLVVEVGTTVTWTNADPIPHTASAGTPVEPTRFFESLSLNSGANYSFTFTEGGEYPYFCRVHPRTMQAVVKVVAAEEKARMEREATPTPVPEPTPRTEPTATPTPVPNAEISRDDGSAATPTPISTGRVSEIRNFTLENITIPVGTTVTWTNRDSVPHTSSAVGRVWESDALFEGQSFSFKFTQVGQFEYFCQFHPMRATVTVTGG